MQRSFEHTSMNVSSSTTGSVIRRPTVSILTSTAPPRTVEASARATRSRTLLERQPYVVAYSAAISLFSPAASCYQLSKLYNIRPGTSQMLRMSLAIFPHQAVLKVVQMNLSTPVKEHLNPWAAFAAMGILQGGIYGQANVHFSNALKLGKVASIAGVFRGAGFAGCRDMISQGVPFMCSDAVRSHTLDHIWTTEENTTAHSAKQMGSVLSTSVVATYLSQGLHNFQITMQTDQSLGYGQAIRSVIRQHGMLGLIRGAEARVGLLLIVNGLNELLLKPAWSPVPV
jgi:hypothetical protein